MLKGLFRRQSAWGTEALEEASAPQATMADPVMAVVATAVQEAAWGPHKAKEETADKAAEVDWDGINSEK